MPSPVSPAKKAIKKRLMSYAIIYADRQGFRFGDGAEKMLTKLATDAATTCIQKAQEEKKSQKVEVYTRQAEAALSSWVDHMISASREIQGYSEIHPGIIGEETFARAKKLLCPCFPIC
jgi:hypothetical protein